jgi:NAD(P)-dependent dehydrogenase (short-subunit alcohol dehydrogenase family)
MQSSRFSGKTALITGAASGIGRETALAFARAGADLVLCDVEQAGLAETEARARALGRQVLARRVDVASKDEMAAFAAEVHAAHEAVDVLVNNAGVGLSGGFLDTTLEDWEWILSINLWGVIHGCHFFIPPMVARRRGGQVVNLSSTAGFVGNEALAAYCTTKFGVFGLSESLREELGPHGISVATICPGIINTPITKSSRLRGKWSAPGVQDRIVDGFAKRNYGPEKVAEAILAAAASGATVVPVSPEAWTLYVMKRIAPRLTAFVGRRVAAKLLDLR